MKIYPVEAELFDADGRTGRCDEGNSRFLVILWRRLKKRDVGSRKVMCCLAVAGWKAL